MDELKRKILSGLIWRYTERFGNQVMQFVISIVLARLLTPDDFGLIALNTIFLVIAGLLTDSGFISAIIQKKEIDQLDLSTVFFVNLFIATTLYLLLFFLSPQIAIFYNTRELIPLLRVQSLILFFSALDGVQNALLSRKMQFKKSFRITLTSTIINGGAGIFLAYKGFGVWSLIISQLLGRCTSTVLLWSTIGWRPSLEFSYSRFKGMFAFSSRFLGVGLLTAIFNNIISVFIGRFYTKAQLGFYNRGHTLPALVVDNITNTIGQVMLPALSSCQDDKQRIKNILRQLLVCGCYCLFFFLILLAAVAKPLIIVLYTEKWVDCVPFLQISCLGFLLYPLNQANQVAINSVGRSDLHLKYDIIKKIVILIFLVCSIPFGIYVMILAFSISSIISALISTIPCGRLINYSGWEQCKDIFPSLLIALIVGIIVWALHLIISDAFICLVTQVIVGIILFLTVSHMLKIEGYLRIRNMIISLRAK